MIKKQKIIVNLIFVIIILQLFSLSISSSGLLSNDPANNLQANSPDETLIEANSCSEIAQWDNNYGDSFDIFVQETLMSKIAYVALGSAGLIMYDISNPSNPKLIGHYIDSYGDLISQVIVVGKFAFAIGGEYGLKVIDVSSPKNPRFIIDYDAPGYLTEMVLQGDYIYGRTWETIQVIDIGNPRNPYLIDSYPKIGEGTINELRIKDSLLFLVCYEGIEIVDITNPSYLLFVTIWEFNVEINSFDFYGSTAIISDSSEVRFYDISNSSNFTLITNYLDVRCYSQSILVIDHYVFSFGYLGFICFDVENPNNIIKANEFIRESGYAFFGIFHDEFIYLLDYFRGIEIVYIGDLTIKPLSAGKIVTSGSTRNTLVQDDIAYVSDLAGGLEILNVKNPSNPKLISRYNKGFSYYTSVYLEDTKLYLTNYATNEIEILDVSDPATPIRLSSLQDDLISMWVQADLIVKEDIAFCISSYDYTPLTGGFLHIVNCTNPANISILYSILNLTVNFYDICLVENYLFLATSEGLLIYEIATDYNLTLISEYSEISSLISGVVVENDIVYLAARDYGLIILDISDIENPNLIRSYNTDHGSSSDNGCYNIFVENIIIYLTDNDDGLLVFDGTDINNPILIGNYERWDYSPYYGFNMLQQVYFNAVYASKNVVYLSCGYTGLLIVHHNDLPTYWRSTQNIIIISISTTVPLFIGGLIAFVIWRIKKRR